MTYRGSVVALHPARTETEITATSDLPVVRPVPRASERRFVVLLLLAWAGVILPLLVSSVLSTKYRTGVGDQQVSNGVAVQVQRGFAVLLLAWCLFVLLSRVRSLPTDRWWVLFVLLAPWLCMAFRDLYNDQPPVQLSKLLYPAIVVAIWVLRPPLGSLSLLAYLTGLTALVDIALALLLPGKGLFASVTGEFITPAKEILPWGILVGIFSGGNVAAQFLVSSIPTVVLVRYAWHRVWLVLLVGFALVWTSSRTALAAFAVVLALLALLALLPPRGRAAATMLALTALLGTVAAVPLSTHTYAAFTNRGYIWQMSLAAWDTNRTFGLGSDWYARIGRFMNDLPSTAYHGHNLLVHSLVIGGYLYAALMLVIFLALGLKAVRWAARGASFPAAMLAGALVSSTLEVPFGLIDRSVMLVVTAVPFAVILFSPLPRRPVGPRLLDDAEPDELADLSGADGSGSVLAGLDPDELDPAAHPEAAFTS
jgi:O-antigen ligase